MRPRHASYWLGAAAMLLLAFLYAPLASVVIDSFNAAPRGGAWQGFTLRWHQALWFNDTALHAARITLALAFMSTAVSTLLGTWLALGLSPQRFLGKRIIETTLLGPVIVPDILMAAALLLLFRQAQDLWAWFRPGLLTMTLAHVTFQIPFVALVVRARLADFDLSLDEAARDLGATRWQAFRHVKLPLIWPGIAAGALMAFTLSLDDFVVSFFTTGPGSTTLPILIYSSVKRGVTPEINALSTWFIAAAILGTVAITRLRKTR